jgi:hypothetical protein
MLPLDMRLGIVGCPIDPFLIPKWVKRLIVSLRLAWGLFHKFGCTRIFKGLESKGLDKVIRDPHLTSDISRARDTF